VQTTLYGKGLVAAPLGAGANVNGGGGYGTKGRGGGQAGYGKMSLIGSAGTSVLPLGHEALIEGGLDMSSIEDVILRNMAQVRYCYEQGLQVKPSLKGRVKVSFVIGARGRVRTAGVANTTLGSNQVESCIVSRLKTWKFPQPEGGFDVKVSYPFSLQRASNRVASN
ncbi:MAG TPA: AgmX/PglI C-terminal domain-containing protein, partial [Bdellovibrionales bacterium]|nr:AgmX/PglI C-terminal domain-containing protein [Bdellovibrionales bacterium]